MSGLKCCRGTCNDINQEKLDIDHLLSLTLLDIEIL